MLLVQKNGILNFEQMLSTIRLNHRLSTSLFRVESILNLQRTSLCTRLIKNYSELLSVHSIKSRFHDLLIRDLKLMMRYILELSTLYHGSGNQ